MSKYCIVLCFLLFGVTLSVSAQADCFSDQELQEMLTYDGHQLDSLLRSTGDWSFIDKEEKVKYILGNDTLELDMVVWQNFFVTPPVEIYLFYRDTTFQILEFSASKQCYQALLMQIARQSVGSHLVIGTQRREYKIHDHLSVCFDQLPRRDQFVITYYDAHLFKQLVQNEPERLRLQKEWFDRQIVEVQEMLSIVESLGIEEQYAEALLLLDSAASILPDYDPNALNIPDYYAQIVRLKRKFQKKREDQAVADLITKGVDEAENGNLTKARDIFQQALEIDNLNERVQDYLQIVERKIAILQNRDKTIYDYSQICRYSYNKFIDSLCLHLQQPMALYPKGSINLDCSVVFDTNGHNLSYIVERATQQVFPQISAFTEDLTRLMYSSMLIPAAQEGFLVNARTDIPLRLSWSTNKAVIKYKLSQITAKPKGVFDSTHFDFKNYAQHNDYVVPGKYTFAVQQITSADSSGYQVWLKNYKYVGPEAAVYSLLVPGLGTLLATQGQRGALVTGLFYGVAGVALLTAGLYTVADHKLENISDDNNYQKMLKSKQIFKGTSIGCISVGAGLYVFSFGSALHYGIQNKRNANRIKNMLKEGPIMVDPYL